MCGDVDVEAESVEDAVRLANETDLLDHTPLPEGTYVDASFALSSHEPEFIRLTKEVSIMPNIIQLHTAPVAPEERITRYCFDIEDELLRCVAEYVDEEAQPAETLASFQQCLAQGNPHVEPIYEGEQRGVWFREGFAEEYFREAHAAFVRLAAKLARETTLEGFIRDQPEGDIFALSEAYNDRYGWYVYYDTMTITLDDFMRHHAKPAVRYYFGGIVYYHT